MPYDPKLAQRIRMFLAGTRGLDEKKMFGGIGWMIHGHMAAGAHSDGHLIIRCSKDDFISLLDLPGARAMKRGETPMRGWVVVDAAIVAEETALAEWLHRGCDYASSLPPKAKG